ncbi:MULTISPECIES: TonB-dependent receptor [Asticcacaulis]|uniref:TonB-dependent receptor n=1 Tax=Asticcacaulis TaxID=76890 RepID=UPI001AE9C969|nr:MULTISPECIES: TonB-dependent receptor [Asticcacaulis]MBP2159304.1 TonB-dependent receptor [Asticcacaulis solisilvae]MDR6800349.1 TonB-dependent receptor [Asticcacaulis sp. BE141]
MKFRAQLFGGSVAVASAIMAVACAHAQTRITFDVPPGALSDSLLKVARAGRTNIVFSPDAVSNRQAPAIRGALSVGEALQRLLAGTDLSYTQAGGTYVVKTAVSGPARTPPRIVAAKPVETLDAPVVESPVVVVTGYRSSLEMAIRLKRSSGGIADTIVAEDMAKFPDNNMAEAIQRVSGVAISRDQGEGRSVSVRGLGADFTRVEINGVEAQAATDGLSQGTNRGRGFDFNVFPSEIFNRVDVQKTSRADLPEGSLGATVSLATPRPFDRKGPKRAMAIQASYNDMNQRVGTRATAMVSDTFANDRFGVLVAMAYAATPLEIQGANSGYWNQGTANGGFCKPTTGTGGICDVPADDLAASTAAYDLANQQTVYHPQFYRYTHLIGDQTRFSLTGSAQWRVSDRTLVTADWLYSRFHTVRHDHFLEAIGFSRAASQGGKPEIVPRRVELDANNTLTYGVFDNVDVRSEQVYEDFSTTFRQASISVRHQVSPRLTVDAIIAGSRSHFDNDTEIFAQIDRYNVDGYSYDIRQTGQDNPAISYNFDLTNPDNWYFGPRVTIPGGSGSTSPEIRFRPNYTRYGYDTARLKATYILSDQANLVTGIEAKRYSFQSIAYLFDQGQSNFPAPSRSMSDLTQTFCGLDVIAPPAGTARCWLEPDIDAFVAEYDLFANSGRTALSTTNLMARGYNMAVTENDLSVYAQLNFRRQLFGKPWHGNVGVRAVRTRQRSIFYTNLIDDTDDVGYVLTTANRHYDDILPSLNMALEPDSNTVVRFSAARVMARPPLSSLAESTNVAVRGAGRFVTTGNPNLEPFRGTSYDLSYEWYPAQGEFVALGLFYKDISTFIQNVTRIAPYSTTGLPAELLNGTDTTPADEFSISSVVNTPGGPLTGVELNYQKPLRFLPGAWSGLGVLFNYTYVESRVKYQTTTAAGSAVVEADLTHLSRNSFNASIYYDRGPIQARLSTNYRDSYLTTVPGLYNADASGVDAATYWDCAFSYKLKPGLVLTFEGLNLTNQANVTWDHTDRHLVGDYRLSGRKFYLGVRYTY